MNSHLSPALPALEHMLGTPSPWIIGVVNVTPDSFSDGGHYLDPDKAITHGEQLIRDGATGLDIGGESTGFGATPVEADEEWRRIRPVINALASRTFVSVDTFKASTADKALRDGARMVNDVSGVRADSEMPAVIRKHDAFVTVMFSKEAPDHPHVTERERTYRDIVAEICEFFAERVSFLRSAGILPEKIILDPGMGRFLSADPEVSWEVLRRFEEFQSLKQPLMIGTSRKGFLGGKVTERDPLSQLTALAAVQRGAHFVRTHDVAMAAAFFRTWERMSRR